jgi:predicted extracellular nuclease
VFDGNSQTLDHILVSRSLGRVGYDVVHINAEFADQASDHDPQVARIRLR